MATIDDRCALLSPPSPSSELSLPLNLRQVNASFTGLTSTAITALVFLTVGLTLEDVLKRLRRYKEEDEAVKAGKKGIRDRGMEGWAMGYLYRARTYIPVRPTPDYSKYPFVWAWQAMRLPQKFFELHSGEDATVYVRFLRGCFYWILLQSCTVFPTVLSINFIFSPAAVATTSIDRASLSALVESDNGKRLLWVHVICMWFLSLTWILTLLWIGYGTIRIRRNVLRRLLQEEADASSAPPPKINLVGSQSTPKPLAMELERQLLAGPVQQGEVLGVELARDRGWRYRTVLMRNIPEGMRSEEAIIEYFQHHFDPSNFNSIADSTATATATSTPPPPPKKELVDPSTPEPTSLRPPTSPTDDQPPLITNLVLVRKQFELNETFNKYRETQYLLETAHATLAERVISWARKRTLGKDATSGASKTKMETEGSHGLERFFRKRHEAIDEDVEKMAREGDDALLVALSPFISESDPIDPTTGEPLSIWIILQSFPPKLLDRFQPLIKLKHFRGQPVPAIDYYLAKLNLLAILIHDKRADPKSFEPASSAFVTFRSAKEARWARTELRTRPGSKMMFGGGGMKKGFKDGGGIGVFECKVTKAPEVRDLDWNRLVLVSLSSDIIRGTILQIIIWAATIFWVIPLSFLVGLLSLSSISKYIPSLATYLQSHSATNSLFSNLLPTSIVALLGMLVPTLIGMLTRNGQTFITVSKLHAAVQARYWKWLLINIVLVFCVGLSAFTAVLNAFKQPGSILTVVAAAFPKGATFFVSWLLLMIGVHHGIEHSLFGIPFINHGTIRKLKAPRKREELALPRSMSYFYWVPNHLLVLGVTAIFAILNPLVLVFCLAYFTFALIVFKNQFAHVYWRRWYELCGRLVFRRCFRYSLDTFMVAQVVAVALFFVLKVFKFGGATIPLIPISAFVKLIGTRWFDKLMDELDEAEIDIVCEETEEISNLSVPLTVQDDNMRQLRLAEAINTVSTFATTTLPSLAFHPHQRLPSVPSPSRLATEITANVRGRSASKLSTQLRQVDVFMDQSSIEKSHGATSEKTELQPASPAPQLVTPHAPVIRDDRPVTHLRYDNPAVTMPLTRSLWLSRNPLLPLDLGDTVDYYGRVLVSSEGGNGLLESWDQEDFNAGEVALPDDLHPISQLFMSDIEKPISPGPTDLGLERITSRSVQGTERILVATDVAGRTDFEGESDVGTKRRRSSAMAGMRPPSMQRRGTGASSATSVFVTTPQPSRSAIRTDGDSPARQTHPLEQSVSRPTPPPAPAFQSKGTPNAPSPNTRRATLGPDDYFTSPTRAGAPSQSPDSALNRVRSRSQGQGSFRANRSASHAASHLATTEEGDGLEEGENTITQAEAVREQLLAEAREAHDTFREKEKSRKQKERSDRGEGTFRKWFAKEVAAAPEE